MTLLEPAKASAAPGAKLAAKADAVLASADTPPLPVRSDDLAERLLSLAIPALMLGLLVVVWAWYVAAYQVPHYILPSPARVAQSLVNDWPILSGALLVTLKITFMALGLCPHRRRWPRHPDDPVALGRTRDLPLCGDPAGNTDRGHRAADPDLCPDDADGPAHLRLHCRLLSCPVQHDAGAKVDPITTCSTCSRCMVPAAGRPCAISSFRRPCRIFSQA